MRRILAYALFYTGDLVNRIDSCSCQWLNLYPLYNWLMCRSSDVQGDGPGPWGVQAACNDSVTVHTPSNELSHPDEIGDWEVVDGPAWPDPPKPE